MKLLITGGAGYLGTELIHRTDHEVVATYNNIVPDPLRLAPVGHPP